jgi:hypothetical protein
MTDNNLFDDLSYEGFRKLAANSSLSIYEKIGFPNAYREGYESAIFADILGKLTPLREKNKVILDIGPGCSELPQMLIHYCREQGHQLMLIDSKEMLDNLPDAEFIHKLIGYYPNETARFIEDYQGKVDSIIIYSVLQYVFAEGNIYDFFDKTLSLLNVGGQILIGDIPNISKRKRFFSSETGIQYHKEFMKTTEAPELEHLAIDFKMIDDAVIFGLMMRARQAGFDSYLLPQAHDLPMANRREDLLIQRP